MGPAEIEKLVMLKSDELHIPMKEDEGRARSTLEVWKLVIMLIFKNRKFLFLPNVNSSSLKFLAKLVVDKGGEIVEVVNGLDPETILLINDSFVDERQNLVHEDILRKESDFDIDYIYECIIENSLKCVKVSQVSKWLRNGKLTISDAELVNLTSIFDGQSSKQESFSSSSQSTTDVEGTDEEKDHHSKQQVEGDNDIECNSEKENPTLVQENWSKNELVAKFLDILAHRYKVKGDNFRSRCYNLARIGIQRLPHEIESAEQTQREVSNVGSSIARKIQIILDTGTLPGVHESPQFEKSLNYLSKCHNVGTYTAKRWANLGLKTLSEVTQKFPSEIKSDWPILFGWSFYEDWSIPIPRQECAQIGEIVRQELKSVDPKCQVEIQGSYLRGACYCGDLDMLFYKENCNDITELSTTMEEVAIRLYHRGYIRCFLRLTPKISELFAPKIYERFDKCNLKVKTISPSNELLKKLYLGIQIPAPKDKDFENKSLLALSDHFMSLNTQTGNPCRRVDFFSCKWSELGASRLQWTGPKEFNRWLRLIAIEKGMKLTQHGLFDETENLLESFDENRIFQLLGRSYIEPEERNNIFKKRRFK